MYETTLNEEMHRGTPKKSNREGSAAQEPTPFVRENYQHKHHDDHHC
jgi:hypothetical protein